jgi:hypothetical protein
MDHPNATPGQGCEQACCTSDPVRLAALERLRRQRHQHIQASLAEELMPLVVYYGPRPLRSVPLAQFLLEGWWAA